MKDKNEVQKTGRGTRLPKISLRSHAAIAPRKRPFQAQSPCSHFPRSSWQNKAVERCLSPGSAWSTTITLRVIRRAATLRAACMAAPEETPPRLLPLSPGAGRRQKALSSETELVPERPLIVVCLGCERFSKIHSIICCIKNILDIQFV